MNNETNSKTAIKKQWLFWLFVIVVAGAIGCHGNKGGGDASSEEGLSMAGFNKITDGMDKSEVDKIAHSSGVVQVSAGTGRNKMESYKYDGTNGAMSFAIISFTGGSESAKTQVGLE